MDVFVNKADQFCQVVIGFRTSNSHDDKQLKSTELPQCVTLNGVLQEGQKQRRAIEVLPTTHKRFHPEMGLRMPPKRTGQPSSTVRVTTEESRASSTS